MRLICVALLVAAACGPFGGAPERGPGAGAAPGAGAVTPAPARPPRGAAAVLLQVASPGSYAVSLVFGDGQVVGPLTARLRTVRQPLTGTAPTAMPVVSATNTRLYYLDGDDEVRYLDAGGARGTATRVPGGPRSQSGFAVSPDDRRIAVAAVDYSSGTAATRLYVEDLAGGANHVELPFPVGASVWPVGWHSGQLVVAVGSPPAQSVAGNPYGTFAGYQLIDPGTGSRAGGLACNPAGPLTPSGSACLTGGEPLRIQDFAGHTQALSATPASVVSAAEAPDGGHVAFCCAGGQLELWDVADGSVTSLGPADSPDYGWIDATRLLISDRPALHPRVVDVAAGTSVPVLAAPGRVVARVPGGL